MRSPGPTASLRARSVAFAVACCAVAASFAWRADASADATDAREERELLDAASVAVRLGAGIDGVWVASQAESLGWAAEGTTDARHGALVNRLRVMPGADHPCIAPALAEPAAGTPSDVRLMELYDTGWDVIDLCGADLSAHPELQPIVGALAAFNDAGASWSAVVDARIAAGVDTIPADMQDDFDAYAASRGDDPRFGLPPGVEELADVFTFDLGPDAVPVVGEVGRGADAALYQQELDWLNADEGYRAAAPHAPYEALAAARDVVVAEVESNLLDAVAPLVAANDRRTAATTRQVALATGGLVVSAALALAALVALALALLVRLRHLRAGAERDPLTGVANRVGARSRVDGWFADPATPIAVAVVDLDHFKRFNDELGHAAGDLVLVRTATRLAEHVVSATTSVSRWGGDEFVVVFRLDQTPVDLDAVITRLHAAVTQPIEIEGTLVTVGATIGAATCGCGACGFDDLFRAADRRLYEVKSRGRNGQATGGCLPAAHADTATVDPATVITATGDAGTTG